MYEAYCTQHFGDGKCDSGCNNSGCGWDGGDCDQTAPKTLNGEIILIILVEMEVFMNRTNQFLMAISQVWDYGRIFFKTENCRKAILE